MAAGGLFLGCVPSTPHGTSPGERKEDSASSPSEESHRALAHRGAIRRTHNTPKRAWGRDSKREAQQGLGSNHSCSSLPGFLQPWGPPASSGQHSTGNTSTWRALRSWSFLSWRQSEVDIPCVGCTFWSQLGQMQDLDEEKSIAVH
ncbi:uncharacterized protein LOC126643989 isoform X3 [Myiozetetes cayanensis]|uniref:uncharacterized protein LOC126643989 isoform X3 n=1 Tax=Myiozetetes cayanensis TaxID=478635 RepID=UPI00215F9BE0|nr:uncharacterized protein LOC126643989 isoform X3 [Myiozetetes cayanensis]